MINNANHQWKFNRRIRPNMFGWRGSRLAIRRLDEALAEIRSIARREPIVAAEGAVKLAGKIWPAFVHIDTSSGALGIAVCRTLEALIPIIVAAPAGPPVRTRWLDRLWRAVLEDGVNYLSPIEEAWGEICASAEVASRWADQLLPLLKAAWSDPRPGNYVKGTDICLASLLAAGRHAELLSVLELKQRPIWPWRRYGIRALRAECQFDAALEYAEASRGLNIPDWAIDAECEAILLAVGRREEAYKRYGLTANHANTGLSAFRQIARKYPEVEPQQILTDLAETSGDPGRWFASAKDVGLFDLALRFAKTGRTDPKTLSRASRDFLESESVFAFLVGRIAIDRILAGEGYDITALDLADAVDHFLAAASRLGVAGDARRDLSEMLENNPKFPSCILAPTQQRLMLSTGRR